jgi:cell division protein FtsB
VTKKNKIQISIGFVVVFLFFLLIFFGDNTLLELNRLKEERNVIIKINEDLVRQNDLMENVARQEFGMIGKDEIIIRIDDSKEKATPEKIK